MTRFFTHLLIIGVCVAVIIIARKLSRHTLYLQWVVSGTGRPKIQQHEHTNCHHFEKSLGYQIAIIANMSTPLNLASLKPQVEAALEALLRAADARVCWKQPAPNRVGQDCQYWFLPGVYRSIEQHNSDAITSPDCDVGAIQLILHGDNSFEYVWEMRRPTPRAMEYRIELVGTWSKPVLNRSRRGEEDQRLFLTTTRARFQRLSHYDVESRTWKVTLHTLTRHGSNWIPVGQSERGIPPIDMVFNCSGGGVLESTGAATVAQVLSNSPACRVFAGLTKKVANKLGGPMDVMTEKWLPSKHTRLIACPSEPGLVKSFNSFQCLAEALRATKSAA